MLRMLRLSVAVVAVCMVTACGSSAAETSDRPTGGPVRSAAQATGPATSTKPASPAVPATGGSGYSATLSARLVTTDSLPPGYSVDIATSMSSDAGDEDSGAEGPCSDEMIPLLSGTRLTGTPSAMAAATLSYDEGPERLWVWSEILRTYADDGARRAMSDLRTVISRCPTVPSPDGNTFRFATAPGPRIGDESLHVTESMLSESGTLKGDSVLVRIGTTLVVVQEMANEPGGDKYLDQLAEAALRRYQTTGS
ncbi:hypothetical protein D7147_31110 [Micromonospora musae]|uniref:Sensor domain-containing protein n=1 Tax=Micromonospora musae TaxID=1894970 RepID=A0ABX9QVR5_9ACTN|nr:hypothetical protein [Micromonospora musae]RKN13580.1 hypothetical protein D7147_31110 [Micromonospora musae]